METLYDITKRLGKGQGEGMMWETLRAVSDAIESKMNDKDRSELNARIFGMLSGGHFDEEHAMESVSRMYYTNRDGVKRYAPYWTIPQVYEVYEKVADRIPKAYNEWDFFVTFQMVASDYWMLLRKWWPTISDEQFAEKVADLAVNWLADKDNPYGDRKIWCYLHP